MPVYEYECNECRKTFEVKQRMTDAPLTNCPDCDGAIKKLMSMSSFHLKGGGWYADGYASKGANTSKSSTSACKSKSASSKCKSCPAAASTT